MKITEKKRQTVEAVIAFQCDKCGKRVAAERENQDEWIEFQEKLSIAFTGGFGSILGDGNRFELDLCQHCVVDLLGPYLREARGGCAYDSDDETGETPG